MRASIGRVAGPIVLAALFTFGAACSSAEAQPAGAVARIGYLELPTAASVSHIREGFLRKLRELGWVVGENLIVESRSADGDIARLSELAGEFPANPVEVGLVASLNRPGGNVTGTTSALDLEIFGKQLQLLKEAVPRASRVAILRNPADPSARYMREVEAAARSLGVCLQIVEARGPEEFDRAFAAMARERADALLLAGTATYLSHHAQLAELAAKSRLPSMSNFREYVEAGGLMAYAANMADFVGHAAGYVDKILRGAKPADLPVLGPTKFELIINLETARKLGIRLPESLRQRADQVIE